MIPLRDTVRSSTFPLVTYALIAVNVAMSFYQAQLGPAAESFMHAYGLVPDDLVQNGIATLVTSMFLHGNWVHLIGNMVYLHIFGASVEDRLGHARFLGVYLFTGVLAGVAQILSAPHSSIPIVGASGAIAGVTGAYFFFFPRARIVTLVPVFVFFQIVEIPAVFFLLLWFVLQLAAGLQSLGVETAAGGVAVWAHIGGFVAGMVLGPVLARRDWRVARSAW